MPRRPLFCPICSDLLERLEMAAAGVANAGSRMAGSLGTTAFFSALQASRTMRSRYKEVADQLQRHREEAHDPRLS